MTKFASTSLQIRRITKTYCNFYAYISPRLAMATCNMIGPLRCLHLLLLAGVISSVWVLWHLRSIENRSIVAVILSFSVTSCRSNIVSYGDNIKQLSLDFSCFSAFNSDLIGKLTCLSLFVVCSKTAALIGVDASKVTISYFSQSLFMSF